MALPKNFKLYGMSHMYCIACLKVLDCMVCRCNMWQFFKDKLKNIFLCNKINMHNMHKYKKQNYVFSEPVDYYRAWCIDPGDGEWF